MVTYGWMILVVLQHFFGLQNSTLPVGQTFIWHRYPLTTPQESHIETVKEEVDVVKEEVDGINVASDSHLAVQIQDTREFIKTEEGKTFDKAQESLVEQDEAESLDEPLEEYSRAIEGPSRVILLRQSRTKLYFTSILPTPDLLDRNELAYLDARFVVDFFQLPNSFLSNGSASPSSSSGGSSVAPRGSRVPLPLPEQYDRWAELDPLLYGKAYHKGLVPLGVRVCRQEGWECLIS